jgi:ribonuclease III
MNRKRIAILKPLEERLGYTFQQIDFLSTALTHRSYVNENPQLDLSDNERLEFLGDAVLGLCVSDLLIRKYPDFDEGTLSKFRALMVNEKPLAQLATQMRLGEYLLLGHGEETSGGRQKESLLANALEAVIAAVYLDAGFAKTRTFVRKLMTPLLNDAVLTAQSFDYKTALQEYCQKKFKSAPTYTLLDVSGPDHARDFTMEVSLNGAFQQTGTGRSKKEAQKQAAQKAMEILLHEENNGS